jgi:hypothetical protein
MPMSSKLINAKLNFLNSDKTIRTAKPSIPVPILLQEADNLYDWCMTDKKDLLQVGFHWDLVADLPVRTGALRQSHTRWTNEYISGKECQKQWKDAEREAKTLRRNLEESFSFAFRKFPQEYSKVQRIKEGYSNADMIQDLSDLAALGSLNKDKLEAVGMDLGLLDEARSKTFELPQLLAKASNSRKESSPLNELRNKAYYHLKEAVDEIREAGQYALRDNNDRQKGYFSKYTRKLNQKYRRKKPGKEEL